MKKIVFCLALMVSAAILFAGNTTVNRGANQVNRSSLRGNASSSSSTVFDGKSAKTSGPSRPSKTTTSMYITTKKSVTHEYAYYAQVTKRNGWWEGIGKPLPQNGTKHISLYYKLSKKNSAGHWTLMQAYDGDDRLTIYHSLGTYLLNQYDETDKGANQQWKEKLQTVCQWQFIGDETDKEVLEERGMDANGNIVFTYHPMKVGPRKYTGSYTDAWGMPIFLRTDEKGNPSGANFVHITRDARGYEVKFEFTDQQGSPQKNSDGAYMTIKDYDDQGRQIMEQSCNIVGDPMIDNWGNCGWKHIYSKNGNYRDYYYFDAQGKHMRMPLTDRHKADHVFGYRVYSDRYGRDTLQVFIDSIGQPDVNENGVQKILWKFNDYGYWTYQAYYGSDGQLIASDTLGIAQTIHVFDVKGKFLREEFKDVHNHYANSADGYCMLERAYDGNRVTLENTYTVMEDGSLSPQFEFHADKQGNEIRRWHASGFQRLDSVDDKGRLISCRYFDLDMQPINNPNGGNDEAWSVQTIQYDDEHNTEITYCYDKYGDPYEPNDHSSSVCSKKVIALNPGNHINTYQAYIYNYMKYAYQQQVDEQGNVLAQWDITPYGEHARVGWWDNIHYTCEVDYTIYGKIRTMVGRNEFGEPAYLSPIYDNGDVYHYSDLYHYFDEYGEEITDMDAFKDTMPMALCIEVTDTTIAYPLGLRNGDIILSYGNWTTSEDLRTNSDYFYLEAILCAKLQKKIIVLRHHPETKTSEIIQLYLPKGRPSDLGFYAHHIYYTQKEKQRLLNSCQAYGISLAPNEIPETNHTVLMAVQQKGGLYGTMLYHVYDVKDPGIVLYAMEEWSSGRDTWTLTESIEKWEDLRMFRISGSNLYYTQDMETYQHLQKRGRGYMGMRFIPIRINEVTYSKLSVLLQANREDIIGEPEVENDDVETPGLPMKKKYICGKWNTRSEEDEGSMIIDIQLGKKAATLTSNILVNAEDQGVKVRFIVTVKTTGLTWDLQDNRIVFNTEKMKSTCTIDYFNVEGDEEAVAAYRDKEAELRQKLQDQGADALNLIEQNGKEWTISHIAPDQLQIEDFENPLMRVK